MDPISATLLVISMIERFSALLTGPIADAAREKRNLTPEEVAQIDNQYEDATNHWLNATKKA